MNATTDGTATIVAATAPPPSTGGLTTAVPNTSVSTSKTQMATVGAQLAAVGTLYSRENGRTYPIHWHQLNVVILMMMFFNILEPVTRAHYRAIGIRDLQNAAEIQRMNEIIHSVCFEAVTVMYTVLFNKASRYTGTAMTRFGGIPLPNTTAFPAYVTSLINSIGPIQFAQLPSRGVHIPYFTLDQLQQVMPATYQTYHIAAFVEGLERAKTIAIAAVDVYTVASSAWWTMHVYVDQVGTVNHYSLWSPVTFDDVELHLSLGTLFARNKLTVEIGVINYSTSEYIETGFENPRLTNFPGAIWTYPYFVDSQPAYRALINEHPDNNVPMQLTPVDTAPEPGPSTGTRSKRPRADTRAGSPSGPRHRVVFHYFDHIQAEDLSIQAISRLTTMLNAI